MKGEKSLSINDLPGKDQSNALWDIVTSPGRHSLAQLPGTWSVFPQSALRSGQSCILNYAAETHVMASHSEVS